MTSGAGNFTAPDPKLLIRMHKVIKLKLKKASVILKGYHLILPSKSNLTCHQPNNSLLFYTGPSLSHSATLLMGPVTKNKNKKTPSNVNVYEGNEGRGK